MTDIEPDAAAAAAAAAAPKFDLGAVVGSLSDDNRVTMERKGWLKDGKPAEGFKLDSMVDSYRHLEGLQGKKTLEVPDLANPENFAKWEGHKMLGVPEKPEDYKFERPPLPDGLKWGDGDGEVRWDEAAEKSFRTVMAKHKIGQMQANAAFQDFVQERIGGIVQSQTSHKNDRAIVTASLQKDFGAGLPGALEAGGQAMAFIAEKAGIDSKGVLAAIEKNSGPEAAIRFSIQLSKMLGEDSLKEGKVNGFATGPDAAKAEIATMEADTETRKALFDKKHAGHEQAKIKRARLYALAYPNG